LNLWLPTHTSQKPLKDTLSPEPFHYPVAKTIPTVSTLTDHKEKENEEELKGLVLNQAKAAL